jgi:hypothetical protein
MQHIAPQKVCSLEINPGGGYGLSVWEKEYLQNRVAFFTAGVHAIGYETFDAAEIVGVENVVPTAQKGVYPYAAYTEENKGVEGMLRDSGYSRVHSSVAGDQIIFRLDSHCDTEFHTFDHRNTEHSTHEFLVHQLIARMRQH